MNIPNEIFIAGIHTDAGKTFISALLTLGLDASYWKPVQAGTVPHTDTEWVKQSTGLPETRFLPEAYQLQMPASPHAAAAAEGITLTSDKLQIPAHEGRLIIEGAGGLMVPLRSDYLFIDWLAAHKIPTILVVHTYLGCINHSLLSLEALRQFDIPLLGIIFNEGGRPESEGVIAEYAAAPVIGRVPQLGDISPDSLKACFDEHLQF